MLLVAKISQPASEEHHRRRIKDSCHCGFVVLIHGGLISLALCAKRLARPLALEVVEQCHVVFPATRCDPRQSTNKILDRIEFSLPPEIRHIVGCRAQLVPVVPGEFLASAAPSALPPSPVRSSVRSMRRSISFGEMIALLQHCPAQTCSSHS